MTRMYRRPGALAVLVAGAAVGPAACSGGSSAPQVASLGTSGSGSSAATGSSATSGASGSATQLLGEWTGCLRSHGDASQAPPTIDASKVIHVTIPADFNPGLIGLGASSGSNSCSVYMDEASQALAGGSMSTGHPPKSLVPEVKFAECMRAKGICAAKTGLPRSACGHASIYPGEVRMAPAGAGSGGNG